MCEVERQFVPLQDSDLQAGFTCHESELQRFFHEEAISHEKAGFCRTFVTHKDPNDPVDFPPVLGYFTISMARVTTGDLPADLTQGVAGPPFQLPAALLGRMARDTRVPKSLKFGELLIGEAFRRILTVEREIGCALIVLDAMNDKLVNYYKEQFGFVAIGKKKYPQKMVLPIRDAKEALEPSPPDTR